MNVENELKRLHKIIEKQQSQIDDLLCRIQTQPTVVREYIPVPKPLLPYEVDPRPFRPIWSDDRAMVPFIDFHKATC